MATASLTRHSLSLSLTQHVISIKPFVELYTPGLPRSVRLAFSAPGTAPPPLNAVADVPVAPPPPAPTFAVSAHAACWPSSPQSSSSDSDSSVEDPLSDDLILQFGIFAMCLLLCSSSGINMFHLLSLHRAALLAPIVNVLRGRKREKQKRRFSMEPRGEIPQRFLASCSGSLWHFWLFGETLLI